MLKRILSIVLLVGCALSMAAQTTRVRGQVRDAETGDPLPFVGVYFDGTTIGISTDLEGRYSIETRSPEARMLTATLLGYDSFTVKVTPGSFTEINFILNPDPKQLDAATVRPDDRYIRSILKKLDSRLSANDPENGPDWHSRLYTRIELDATNTEDLFKLGFIEKSIGDIRKYSDTSAVTGKSFIPVMISENLSDVYHLQEPGTRKEIMRSSRISGVEEDNFLRQFTGGYLLHTNFYKPSISVFNLDIPNPAAAYSNIFYNYFLVDSLQVDGRKTYVLRFHPKKLVTSPALDGEMHIDAEDFGIRSVHAALSEASNVNWLRHVNIDISNRRLPDGRWFYDEESLFLDLSLTMRNSSRILSFLGRRLLHYDLPDMGPISDSEALEAKTPVVMTHVQSGDDAYWDSARPVPLSEREQGIYSMVDEIQQRRFYKVTEKVAESLITSYIPVKEWGMDFGRWARTIVFNDVEGFRLQLGGRTRKELTEKVRVGGYVSYAFKSKTWGWQVETELMFRRDMTRKLTLMAQDDVMQLSAGTGVWSAQNFFSSVFARSSFNRQSRIRRFDLKYDHEFSPMFNLQLEWTTERIWGNERVRLERQDHTFQESFSANKLRASLRFSYDERVNRGPFLKQYLFTKYPVFKLDVTGGIKGITRDDVGFFRTDATLDWKTPSFSLGYGRLHLDAGFITGEAVPYQMLKLHAGNQTFFLDRSAFSCMDYYEFISDRWLQGYYEHNFNGFFLGKIPGVKVLDMRELVLCRFAWGTYAHLENAPFRLPANAGTLEVPYVEVGVGLSNILRLLRVDAIWRVTHRREKRNFTINIGIDVEF